MIWSVEKARGFGLRQTGTERTKQENNIANSCQPMTFVYIFKVEKTKKTVRKKKNQERWEENSSWFQQCGD